jgi:hypothetical protein
MHLVQLAYSLLMKQLKQNHVYDWACAKLTTIGEACRAMQRETLRTTLTWAMDRNCSITLDSGAAEIGSFW